MDLRRLPSVDKIIIAVGDDTDGNYSRFLLAEAARKAVADLRTALMAEKYQEYDKDQLLLLACAMAKEIYLQKLRPCLKKVINATGIVLHTNLGRAPLSAAALTAINQTAGGYCNLEIDLAAGGRGHRDDHIAALICALTGAEDAVFVNNNAAAVLLVLDTFAKGREAVVSRGQLVEIGGSFRIPDIMEKSGVILHEVGTTNKTHLADYQRAINDKTAMLMTVHPSNFQQIGFTSVVDLADLVQLAAEHDLLTVNDLGSGCIFPLAAQGIGSEPLINEVLATGVDIITVSGDKLLGGPQSGIILGKRDRLKQIKKNPLLRALRLDKLNIAALEATLLAYLRGDAMVEIPILSMLLVDLPYLAVKAERLKNQIIDATKDDIDIYIIEGQSMVGGGSLPGVVLPTWLISLRAKNLSAAALAAKLRIGEPAVLTYIRNHSVLLDLRTVTEDDLSGIALAVAASLNR